jgi:hypothetical protein
MKLPSSALPHARVVELPTRRGESYRFGPNLSLVR